MPAATSWPAGIPAIPGAPTMAEALLPAALSVRGLGRRFAVERTWLGHAVREVHAVSDVSFDIARGEIVGLVGESGCGKTTLSRMLLKLDAPSTGSIALEGTDVTAMGERQFRPYRRRIQMVFQDPYASLDPRMTVGAILAEGLLNFGLAGDRQEARALAVE